MPPIQPQRTIAYKTYIKQALVEGLRSAIAAHPDTILSGTTVGIDFSFEEVDYPSIVVRYYPRDNQASGVGHVEQRYDPVGGLWYKYRRRIYHGDIEFAIYALSSLDRDLISDSLTQILGMGDVTAWTWQFHKRIYDPADWSTEHNTTIGNTYLYNFLNLNTDIITELPEGQAPAPWQPEDVLLYQGGSRIPVMGEILSIPPDVGWTTIQSVVAYPYIAGLEPVPTGADDPAIWIPDTLTS
jgi:hypothetical protein